MVVDCLAIKTPKVKGHIGTHPDIMDSLLQWPGLSPTITCFAHVLAKHIKAWQGGLCPPVARVGVFDSHGQQRSVAVATVLFLCLQVGHPEVVFEAKLIHFGQWRWAAHTCGGMCAACCESLSPHFSRQSIVKARDVFALELCAGCSQ